MPELAEVEFYRKQWNPGLGRTVGRVRLNARARVWRGGDADGAAAALPGAKLLESLAHGKQMAFRLDSGWLGVHLGMSGALRAEASPEGVVLAAGPHAHLVLYPEDGGALVFEDPRMFGRLRWTAGPAAPEWWSGQAPSLTGPEFTPQSLAGALRRHARAPLKAVLLRQEHFPGIGNWMADEILWRAALHPALPAGAVPPRKLRALHAIVVEVCRDALAEMGQHNGDAPEHWLFNHRWRDGGRCPKTGGPLRREEIGGRTTCWSPRRQRLPRMIAANQANQLS